MLLRIPGETYYDAEGRAFVEPEREPDQEAAHRSYEQLREYADFCCRAAVAAQRRMEGLEAENARLRACLEGMVWQFGHVIEENGERWIGTMGLSDLEWAFEVLGWDDPHPFPADER